MSDSIFLISDAARQDNQIIIGSEGNLTSPEYPQPYSNNVDFEYTLRGAANTRIIVSFLKIDIEDQKECKYDFVAIKSTKNGKLTKHCGHHTADMNR